MCPSTLRQGGCEKSSDFPTASQRPGFLFLLDELFALCLQGVRGTESTELFCFPLTHSPQPNPTAMTYERIRLRRIMRSAALNYRLSLRAGQHARATKWLRVAIVAREASNLT
jgi:hypothetical protein